MVEVISTQDVLDVSDSIRSFFIAAKYGIRVPQLEENIREGVWSGHELSLQNCAFYALVHEVRFPELEPQIYNAAMYGEQYRDWFRM